MNSLQVSVLLPVFNAAKTLPACLRSLQRQSLSAWECILVDDGSTDGSAELARTAAQADARIRVLAEPHSGIVAALNTGLAQCRAPLVARMDADDVMRRQRLAAQVAALAAQPGWSAAGCHVRLAPRRQLSDGMRAYERWLNSIVTAEQLRRDAYIECPVAHPTLIARTQRLRALGYRQTGWPEDYDLLLRLLAEGDEIGVLPRRLLQWHDAPTRLSRSDARYTISAFTACKAHHLARGLLAKQRSYALWGYGSTGRTLARALASHDKHAEVIVEVHPRRIGNQIQGARVIAPEALDEYRGLPLIVSVAGAGPRQLIRAALAKLAYRETRDFIVAA